MHAEERETSAGLAPRLLREILRTPAFRELITINMGKLDEDDGRRIIESLFAEGAELPLGSPSIALGALNTAVSSSLALGEQLRSMPEPLLEAFLASVVQAIDEEQLERLPEVWGPLFIKSLPTIVSAAARGIEKLVLSIDGEDGAALVRVVNEIDGVALARSLNELSQLILRLRDQAPTLLRDGDILQKADMAMEELDFGKLRHSMMALSGYGKDAASFFIERALADPIVLSNLVVALPPLINDQLAVLEKLLRGLTERLPDEILASAIFNVMGDFEANVLGTLLTDTAKLVTLLHRGSLILGGTDPAFKRVFTEFLDALLGGLDGEILAQAVVALGEDGEVVAQVIADLLQREPSLLPRIAKTGLATVSPLLRGTVDLLREVNRLPDEVFIELKEEMAEGLDSRELATLIREVAQFITRYNRTPSRTSQDTPETLVESLVAALMQEPVMDVTGQVLRSLVELRKTPALRDHLEPEVIGHQINGWLQRFNQSMNCAGADGAKIGNALANPITRLMSSLDPAELERAWQTVLMSITGANTGDGRLARAVFVPLVSTVWHAALQLPKLRQLRLRKTERTSLIDNKDRARN